MNRWRTTWILFGLAAALFAFIMLFERRWQPRADGPTAPIRLLTFKAGDVTNVAVHLTNQLLLRVERGSAAAPWTLTIPPINYPAQSHSIEWLLAQLENLVPPVTITAAELRASRRTPAEFGLDLPAARLTLQFQGQRRELLFGHRTPFGDQVYVQVQHQPDVFTAPAELLDRLPRHANDWRDTYLIDFRPIRPNRFEVRATGRGFALEIDPTNRVFALTKPLAARADAARVEQLLRTLADARALGFVTDNPNADLDSFGLQPPEAELAIGVGTNDGVVVQFGKSPTNFPAAVFARRLAHTNIVLVPKALLDVLLTPHSEMRDHHLANFQTAAVDSVEVIGAESFTARRQTNGTWTVGETTPVTTDPGLMKDWLDLLARLEGRVEADVVTDFKTPYELNPPVRQYVLRAAATNASGTSSNRVLAEIHLGAVQGEKVFARRPDETAVYALKRADVSRLPHALWQLRDRRVWNFTTNQVAALTLHYKGQTRRLLRSPSHQWNFAPGSQGILNNPGALEETVHRLGQLRADVWTALGEDKRPDFAFREGNNHLIVELRNGEKPQSLKLEFAEPESDGRGLAPNKIPYALALVDGQPRIFEFPVTLFVYVVKDLFYPLDAAMK